MRRCTPPEPFRRGRRRDKNSYFSENSAPRRKISAGGRGYRAVPENPYRGGTVPRRGLRAAADPASSRKFPCREPHAELFRKFHAGPEPLYRSGTPARSRKIPYRNLRRAGSSVPGRTLRSKPGAPRRRPAFGGCVRLNPHSYGRRRKRSVMSFIVPSGAMR